MSTAKNKMPQQRTSHKKLFAIITGTLFCLTAVGLVGLHQLGTMVQAQREHEEGRKNALDCLSQIDDLIKKEKANGTYKEPSNEDESEPITPW